MKLYRASLSAGGSSGPEGQMRILFVSYHDGTIMDFAYVCRQLKLACDFFRPPHEYAVSHDLANKIWNATYAHTIDNYDVAIFCDTVVAARPVLQHIDDVKRCRITLLMTNRFDYDNSEDLSWRELMLQSCYHRSVRLLQNNPYEQVYLRRKIPQFNVSIETVRPTGMWPDNAAEWLDLDTSNENVDYDSFAVLCRERYSEIIVKHRDELAAALTVLHGLYGGPGELAKYRGVIVIPYQFSVMSMWEYVSHGIACFVPTQRFFRELLPSTGGVGIERDFLDYAEWYLPEHEDLFIFYDDWRDLSRLLLAVDLADHRAGLIRHSRSRISRIIEQWRGILNSPLVPALFAEPELSPTSSQSACRVPFFGLRNGGRSLALK